jgi:hypothetical protein
VAAGLAGGVLGLLWIRSRGSRSGSRLGLGRLLAGSGRGLGLIFLVLRSAVIMLASGRILPRDRQAFGQQRLAFFLLIFTGWQSRHLLQKRLLLLQLWHFLAKNAINY